VGLCEENRIEARRKVRFYLGLGNVRNRQSCQGPGSTGSADHTADQNRLTDCVRAGESRRECDLLISSFRLEIGLSLLSPA